MMSIFSGIPSSRLGYQVVLHLICWPLPNHHGMIYPTLWIPKVGKTMMYHGNSMDFLRFSPTEKNGLPHGLGILGDSQQLISLKKTMNTPTPSFDFPIPPVKHGSHLQGWSLQRPAIMFIHFPYGDPIWGLYWPQTYLFGSNCFCLFGFGNVFCLKFLGMEMRKLESVKWTPFHVYIYMCVASWKHSGMEKGSTSCKPQKHQVILISLGIRSGDGFDGRRVAGFTSRFHPHHFTTRWFWMHYLSGWKWRQILIHERQMWHKLWSFQVGVNGNDPHIWNKPATDGCIEITHWSLVSLFGLLGCLSNVQPYFASSSFGEIHAIFGLFFELVKIVCTTLPSVILKDGCPMSSICISSWVVKSPVNRKLLIKL